MNQFVFIGGVGRSGTSITRELLAKNSSVASFPFEYRFIIDPDGIVDFIRSFSSSWSPYFADRKIKRLEQFLIRLGKKDKLKHFLGKFIRSNKLLKRSVNANAYHGWELAAHFPNYFEHVKSLINKLTQFEYQSSWAGDTSFKISSVMYYSPKRSEEELYSIFKVFFDNLYNDFFESQKKQILVEDNTWNLLFATELAAMFNNAKFIHVFRDPRDIVSSYCQQRWMPSDKIQSAIICKDLYCQILDKLKSIQQDCVFQVSIEELVNDKTNVLKSISKFTGISLTDEMLDFNLSNSSFGRWKNDFSKEDLNLLEPYLKGITERLGYEW